MVESPPNRTFFDKLKKANRKIHRIDERMTFEEMVLYMDKMSEGLGLSHYQSDDPHWADGHLKFRSWTKNVLTNKRVVASE